MREVLTPEQRRQFAERMQNRWGNYKNREMNRVGGKFDVRDTFRTFSFIRQWKYSVTCYPVQSTFN